MRDVALTAGDAQAAACFLANAGNIVNCCRRVSVIDVRRALPGRCGWRMMLRIRASFLGCDSS
jgi:hypothetical protein